jgi:hypothetical protein
MHLKSFKTTGILLLSGLLMPAGMLLASDTYDAPAVTSSTANWYNVEQASNLFNHMNTLALETRKEVARLQVQGYQLSWRDQAARLAIARNDINTMAKDLKQLNGMKTNLEPWQQSLLSKVRPNLHAMVYQTGAAIQKLNAREDRTYLSMTQYPQNIDQIFKNANQMTNTIGTVTQYAHAEQKMAALNSISSTNAGS